MTNMTPTENLYYALGELAYAMACADGEVQKAERQKFLDMIRSAADMERAGCDIAGIIFQIMDKEKVCLPDAYERALKQIRLNSHYVSPDMKYVFRSVIEKVARAYPPVTSEEQEMMNNFNRELKGIKGDPVYFPERNKAKKNL